MITWAYTLLIMFCIKNEKHLAPNTEIQTGIFEFLLLGIVDAMIIAIIMIGIWVSHG